MTDKTPDDRDGHRMTRCVARDGAWTAGANA